MRFCTLTSALCLLTSTAHAQWSEPGTVAESIAPYGSGPELVPARGDTLWVLWVRADMPYQLMSRRFAADTWRESELLAQGAEGLHWPAGITDDSGHLVVAFYEGSYPLQPSAAQDSWAIYVMTRTDTGWTRPQFTHA